MKKVIASLLIATVLAGCGEPRVLTVDGKTKEYPTYGLLNMNSAMSSRVCYEVSMGNTILSIFLIETIVAPIYFIGFSLFNPVRVKEGQNCNIDGV